MRRGVASIGIGAALISAIVIAPSPARGYTYNLCGPQADQFAPTISDVSLSTTAIDISKHAQPITVTAHVADPNESTNSGVRRVEVQLEGPRDEVHADLAMTAGTVNDGTWSYTFMIPTTSNSGDWNVRLIGARDRTYNWTYFIREGKYPQNPFDPRLQSGWTTDFTVTGTPDAPSYKPGTVRSLTFNHTSVDTRHGPATVVAHATFSKPQPKSARLELRGRTSGHNFYSHKQLHLGSDGTWSRRITVPAWAGSGKAVASLYLRYPYDVRPDYKSIQTSQLRSAGLPTSFRVKGKADVVPPTLMDFSYTPNAIDTTSHTETLTVNATATDRQSGVSNVYVDFANHDAPVTHFGQHRAHFRLLPPGLGVLLTRQHGNDWSGSTTVPMCNGKTQHLHAIVQMLDAAGNRIRVSTSNLTAAGFSTKLSVASGPAGDTEGPGINASSASGVDHTITLDFDEGVKNVGDDTVDVYDDAPSPDRFTATLPISSIVCSNGIATVDCDGSTGLVTSAVLTVPDVVGKHKYVVSTDPNPTVAAIQDAAGNLMGSGYSRAIKAD
jgi:hypothetical protein